MTDITANYDLPEEMTLIHITPPADLVAPPAPLAGPAYTADEKLKLLAVERLQHELAKGAMAELVEALKQSDTYGYYLNKAQEHADSVERLEAEIKADFLAAFDGNKKPHAKVQVKTFRVVDIQYPSLPKMFEWCLGHFTPALKVDTKVLDKAAEAGSLPADLAVVHVTEENRVQIATNLNDLL